MFKVKTLNHISPSCMDVMTPDRYEIADDMADPDAIFVRATNMHNYEFNPALRCIARAGIGVNSIPLQRCSENGIVVFNTPGGNANAVKELFLFGLGMASRDLMGGMRWVYGYDNNAEIPVEVSMEKIKKQFAGPEYYRKTLGVIGTGNVGSLVANIALDLGMKVLAYDPYLSVNAAWRVSAGSPAWKIWTLCSRAATTSPSTPPDRRDPRHDQRRAHRQDEGRRAHHQLCPRRSRG